MKCARIFDEQHSAYQILEVYSISPSDLSDTMSFLFPEPGRNKGLFYGVTNTDGAVLVYGNRSVV